MSQVKIGQFKFGEDTFNLRYIVDDKEVKFVAKDVASSLKYDNTAESIRKYVNNKYKTTYNQGERITHLGHNALVKQGNPLYLHPSTVLINKSGVIQLIMRSKLPHAVELQAWLLEEVIPQVLCTGKYAPAVENTNQKLLQELKVSLIKKDELIKYIIETKDEQITRVMADLNRMYNGFQDTMRKKDEIMQKKDEQVTELVGSLKSKDEQVNRLLDRMVDLAGRAVQYPADQNKMPVLCVAQQGNAFSAITGQRAYVQQQKHKRGIDADRIVVEQTRPNPTLDWNNAMEHLRTEFDGERVKRRKREVLFESDEDARQFANRLKRMLDLCAQPGNL
uniref:DekiORF111 n=1 Tax=Dendrolimus kikuchii nucleopolyhedrovirus TaxID=1219875 RepID=V9LSZ6_9ABAC|nr:DekiORF111 [Dendrolimus kikuchii nucleopolyhedrovirus]